MNNSHSKNVCFASRVNNRGQFRCMLNVCTEPAPANDHGCGLHRNIFFFFTFTLMMETPCSFQNTDNHLPDNMVS